MASTRKRTFFVGTLEGAFERFLRRSPKQSRSRALVSAVVQALEEQLASGKSVDEITIEELSERAGVGVGSFYEYFAGKDSLLGALVGRITDRNFEELSRRLDAHGAMSLEELVEAFSRDIAETYLGHPHRLRVVAHAIGRLGLLAVVNRERDRFAELMAARIQGLLPDADPDRLGRTMQLMADGAMGILVSAAERAPPGDVDTVSRELVELGLGLLAQRHPMP